MGVVVIGVCSGCDAQTPHQMEHHYPVVQRVALKMWQLDDPAIGFFLEPQVEEFFRHLLSYFLLSIGEHCDTPLVLVQLVSLVFHVQDGPKLDISTKKSWRESKGREGFFLLILGRNLG